MNLAVRKLFSFPHAQILLAFFCKNVLRALHEAVGFCLERAWQAKGSLRTPACKFRVRESPAKLGAAVSSAKSLAV
jgi:hypothetical protein